jgi:hypothetical protein
MALRSSSSTVSDEPPATPGPSSIPGIAPGVLGPVLSLLRSSSTPIRRRKILEELERTGHRISLAGLNRILQQCAQSGLTVESPEGVRLKDRRG